MPLDPKTLRRRWLALIAIVVALPLGPSALRAADPQPYKVTVKPTGDAAIDTAAHDSSTLVSLHDSAPVGPFALVARARDDLGRFNAALQSYGYYKGEVAIRIAGRPLDDPALPDLLDQTPATTEVPVEVTLTRGPLFHLRRVDLNGEVPADARAEAWRNADATRRAAGRSGRGPGR